MHGKKKRWVKEKPKIAEENPKQKRVSEKGRATVKSRLRNLEDNWEMISERFIKGNKNES